MVESKQREREYILLINLTIHLDTHTRKLRKLKRTSKTEYLIYNLYETNST